MYYYKELHQEKKFRFALLKNINNTYVYCYLQLKPYRLMVIM